jgi:phospholipid transport system transporter-binding protein
VTKLQRAKTQLESQGEGRFRVGGVLDATTATRLLEEARIRFSGAPQVVIDFSGVTQSDSAGLALLLEWLRRARKENQQIRFEQVPQQIVALARISEVDDLLLENGAVAAEREPAPAKAVSA